MGVGLAERSAGKQLCSHSAIIAEPGILELHNCYKLHRRRRGLFN